jgi:hypothetical protein
VLGRRKGAEEWREMGRWVITFCLGNRLGLLGTWLHDGVVPSRVVVFGYVPPWRFDEPGEDGLQTGNASEPNKEWTLDRNAALLATVNRASTNSYCVAGRVCWWPGFRDCGIQCASRLYS